MMDTAHIAALVAQSARTEIDLANARLRPEHDYASVPLCIIDAVFSIAAKYESVTKPTVARFAQSQNPAWPMYGRGSSQEHTIHDFLNAMSSFSGEALADTVFKNRQRTSTRNGILKAEACRLFAKALVSSGIDKFADIAASSLATAEIEIRKIPGQNISFDYFILLAGAQTVKADRMIMRFVRDAAGILDVSPQLAKEATIRASELLRAQYPHVDARLLDSELWTYQSQRAGTLRVTNDKSSIVSSNFKQTI